ncbi:MAG: thioredoxin family protein, partial [Oscillospiraceae bacterium]
MNIKVLGSGCSKCNALEKATADALKELNISIAIDHITDFVQIA